MMPSLQKTRRNRGPEIPPSTRSSAHRPAHRPARRPAVIATGESKIAAVVGVSPDDATIVLRALVRSESEPRAFLCVDDDANDVVASSRCVSRVFESDFSQRKADRRDDPHGEHAVDCWTVRDAVM